jgi:precorrin-2 dehydrogenase/sirohydrochlorin ferrochelatase
MTELAVAEKSARRSSGLLPLALHLRGKACLCIGGGSIAARRVPALLAAGGRVRVVAPRLHPALRRLADAGDLTWEARRYQEGDCSDAFLVLAATGDEAVDEAVAAEGLAGGGLVCVASGGGTGNCQFMATIRRGSLLVAVQTGGAAPAVAAAVRSLLEDFLPEDIGGYIDQLADLRRQAKQIVQDTGERARRWRALEAEGAIALALRGEAGALDRIRTVLLAP